MTWPVSMFRLVSEPAELGLYCGKDGLTLCCVPLLVQNELGFTTRSPDELDRIFAAAYGVDSGIDAASRMNGLQSVARALNENDLSRAIIISLMLKLPDIDDAGAARLSALNRTQKFHYNDAEPRDWRGWWTTGGSGNPNVTPVQLAPPFPILGPPIPGTFGAPKPKDDDFVFPNNSSSDASPSNNNTDTQTNTVTTENTDKPLVCPDPSYEVTSVGRKDEELHYQAQINGLKLGWHVVFNNIGYDGCDDKVTPEILLEAKKANGWFMTVPEAARPYLKEYRDTMKQASSQNYGSDGHIVEWNYSDLPTSIYWAKEFKKAGLSNLVVKFTPYDPNYPVHKLSFEDLYKYPFFSDRFLGTAA